VGRPLADAVRTIQDAGLKIGNVRAVADTAAQPTSGSTVVVHQSPAPGQKVIAGAAIDLDVAR
jgi:beta-lactam-binding protein with PASTA domain